ncbi:hypothetical protein SAMN02745947_03198 [Rhodococcus rhodochrous J3]|jgi:hypothetical protein|uniref:MT0933-like antitoxin protein n=1 Tax=Rhodococcus rhodochrous J3 TaxID=903528 RepID=A0ABY1MFC5_RHORH|nr:MULTISPECIES: hypothetical protein [Rhodococcus]AYA25800.1 hypothetical protein C6369_015850 [Rhodococcus rhodochrous]MBF4481174.1 hypothetical protein [Rhodococcus rhodochrous]MCB8912367.1 DUF4640 domain-containing protein [Rhodococcus rhodochrous]MCD2098512.1 DUF4640 domain-containing protein [Rhodococcus rhodochrous]MCD2123008.1 DUF4640 domain-containing protein [Rhodococcus rhodochrous]
MDNAPKHGSGRPEDNDDLTGQKIKNLVDKLEQKVENEREEEGAPGNVADRVKTEKVEPDDQAPE